MNNFYTLIYLKNELNEKIAGSFFRFAISPYKNVLEFYLDTRRGLKRLIFSSDPGETAIFLDSFRPPKKNNTISFFPPLQDEQIVKISLADQDRLLYIYYKNGMFLLFKLYGGSPNCYLVDKGVIIDAFKNSDNNVGQAPPEPSAPKFASEVRSGISPKNQLTRLNPLLPRGLLPYRIEQHRVEEMNTRGIRLFTQKITDALLTDPRPRVLESGDLCLWSEEILRQPTEKSFDEVNEAVLYAFRNAVHLRRLNSKKGNVLQYLERLHERKVSQLQQLQQADKSLARADEYEKFGHLLMANAHVDTGYNSDALEVADFYDDNKPIRIPLKDRMSVAENAEYYYEKAKSARRSYEQALRRIPDLENEASEIETLIEELKEIQHLPDLEKWTKNNEDLLQRYGYGTEDAQPVSPFRKLKVGKYEIWIGKNAKSNDELTGLAHKEDIWLHARGVSGSHVVIRMGNRKDFPPKDIILRAAGFAAFYSKARGMKTAPVMYTKRKYVRKPKGAAPGAVVVEREKVEMVPPLNPKKLQR
jgi:predicted ribosome quality control (RQC) complex YloA/Tae2 family protein